MAVVRSLEGTFYDIPDSELEQYKVPADQVKGLMEAAGQKPRRILDRNRQAGARAREARAGAYGWIAADPCPVHNAGGRRSRGRRRPDRSRLRGLRREARRRTSSLNGTG